MKNITTLKQIESEVATLKFLAKREQEDPTGMGPQLQDELKRAQNELAVYFALSLPSVKITGN